MIGHNSYQDKHFDEGYHPRFKKSLYAEMFDEEGWESIVVNNSQDK